MRDYYEQFYANILDKFNEKEKFLERHKLQKLTKEGSFKMKRLLSSKMN